MRQRIVHKATLFGVLIAGVLTCAQTSLAQSVGLATAAIENHQSVSLHNWRFDRLRHVGEKKIRERCKGVSFRQAECRLLEVDGAPPDEKAQERYAKSTPQPVEENLPNIDPAQFVNLATLAVARREDALQAFSFDGAADSADEYAQMGRQKGTMFVHREEGHIQSLTMHNSEAFKPAFAVKINEMAIDIDFVRIGEDVFASAVSMMVRGKMGGLKSIGEDNRFEFENFTPPQ